MTDVQPRVVLLATEGRSTNVVYHALESAFGVQHVVIEDAIPRTQLLKMRRKRWGLRKVAGQILFRAIVVPPLQRRSESRIRAILEAGGLDDSPIPTGKVTRVSSVNTDEVRGLLRSWSPDVVVINGTRIVGKKTLGSVDCPFLNIHVGITPTYRGVHGGYWALAERDVAGFGVTVYTVDAGIDTGEVIGQATATPTSVDTFATYPFLQLAAGVPLLIDAVAAVSRGELRTHPVESRGASKLWTHPTLGEYLFNRIVRRVR